MDRFVPQLKVREWGIVLGVVAIFLGIAMWNLTKLPIFVDEALYLRWAQIAWKDASWRFISLTDGKQPLYIWFVIPFMKLIQDPLAAGRMASVVSGLFTVLGMGYLGWLLRDKKTGLIAMILAALSPYLFFYYRFGIMESTLIAAIIWVCSFAVLLARTRRLDIALLLGMVGGAALLVKSSALFFVILIPAAYLLEIDIRKPFVKKNYHYFMLVVITWLLAFIIYNVQRLSPWMHMIAEKNAFFTVRPNEILDEPIRLLNNFLDVWRWQWAYSTAPVLAAAVYGLYSVLKNKSREGLLILIWLIGPVLGTVAVAKLFAPRYIIYATPFVLLFAAYGIAELRKVKMHMAACALILLIPLYLITRLITDPIHFPYVRVDEGYVNGWSAGNGTKQIAEWARDRALQIGNQQLVIYTEGTFGILPHGLELYAQGIPNLTVTGVYPVNEIPPQMVVAEAQKNSEVYLILNNTETPTVPDGLELVMSHDKLRDNPMRLYRVVPR